MRRRVNDGVEQGRNWRCQCCGPCGETVVPLRARSVGMGERIISKEEGKTKDVSREGARQYN